MARAALSSGNRVVDACSDQFGKLRRMGVMTGGATPGFHGIIPVGLFEGGGVTGMAGQAELWFGGLQQVLLTGAVGRMAGPASLLQQNLVDHLAFEVLLLMAEVTDQVPLRLQQFFPFCPMGIMAGRAFPFFQRRMDDRHVHADLSLFVTLETELVTGFL